MSAMREDGAVGEHILDELSRRGPIAQSTDLDALRATARRNTAGVRVG